MPQNSLTVRVGGDSAAGGIVTTGEVFARIAAYAGLEVYTTRTIPAEIKGGHVMFQARIAPEAVWSQGDVLDMLIAFDQESIDRYYKLVRPGGILIYNSNDSQAPAIDGIVQYGLPLNDLAKSINFQRGRNIITIGAMVKLFGLAFETAKAVVEKQLGRKKEMLEQNLLALQTGFEYIEQNVTKTAPYHLTPKDGAKEQERLVISGNQALAMGSIAAGCRFYAGYPITPATDIMEFLAGEFPRIGGTVIQAEDEIAAIAMTFGASYDGVRSMTATSGPGLSLMVEMLGHATMAEIPMVVVDVQRAGPSTGMPTKVSQGDLRISVFGAHDDAPRIVVAPVSVEDNFYQDHQRVQPRRKIPDAGHFPFRSRHVRARANDSAVRYVARAHRAALDVGWARPGIVRAVQGYALRRLADVDSRDEGRAVRRRRFGTFAQRRAGLHA